MYEATRAIRAEGTVSKRKSSPYRLGRSRQWLKAKHKVEQKLQVADLRRCTSARPGGLIVPNTVNPSRWGSWLSQSASGLLSSNCHKGTDGATHIVLILDDRIQAIVHNTARTSTHGHLREGFVLRSSP